MYRIFKERGVNAGGKLLTRAEFLEKSVLGAPQFAPEKMPKIIEAAEGWLEEDIPFLNLSLYREFKITGNRSNFSTPFSKRRDMLFDLSLAEYYEGKGRFTSKLCDVIWAILEETTWVPPAHAIHNRAKPDDSVPTLYKEDDLYGIDLYAGATGALMAMVLTLNKESLDSISPIIAERIQYEIEKRIIKPFISYVFSWSGEYGTKCNNWCAWITSNVLYTVAVAEERQSVRRAVLRRALTYLDNYSSSLPADGGCDEGPGYWGAAAAAYFDALELIYDLTDGEIDVFSHPHVRNMGEYICKVNINEDNFVNFADCSPKFYPDGFLIMRFGEKCGSDSLYAFGRMMATRCSTRPHYRRPGTAIYDLVMSVPEEKTVTRAEKTVWMPALKVMVARESEDTSRGMFLAVKGGHNRESHNHNDVGSFVVYSDGKPVVIDPGSCTYTKDTFGKNRYTIWCMQSHYHNLPAFDGIGEKNGEEYCSTREIFDEDASSITMGLEKAYSPEAGVLSYTRSSALSGATVTVSEDIILEDVREIDFRLMTHREPTKEGDRIILAEGITLEYDPRLDYSVEEFTPDNANPMKNWGTPVFYRMHFKTTAKEFKCEFKFERP